MKYLEHDPYFKENFNNIVNGPSVPESENDFTLDAYDETYLNMELAISSDGAGTEFSWVSRCLRDKDGLTIGKSIDNPILDTCKYEAEYPDEHKKSLTANEISEKYVFPS